MIFKTQYSNIALGEGGLGYWGRGWEAKIELGEKVLCINLQHRAISVGKTRGIFFIFSSQVNIFFFVKFCPVIYAQDGRH